ncbi:MAG: tetratricopeptide repeat protein [Rubricella sp.]
MKHIRTRAIAIAIAAGLALTACDEQAARDEVLGLEALDVVDETNLTQLMLTVSDPEDAIEYFEAALGREPGRVDLRRGYAQSLARAGRNRQAMLVYEAINEEGEATEDDRLNYAVVLVRENQFDDAATQLALVPEQAESFRYNLLNAVVADHFERWADADRYYGRARQLATDPAGVLNNWGVSRMSRGDLDGAIGTFREAIILDPDSFEPKNNLTIARGLQGNFTLPVIPMTETERAQLFHNLALVALRQNEVDIAKGLLRAAVDAHPRHFPAAADKLAALEAIVEL